jgi:hypothetical protein
MRIVSLVLASLVIGVTAEAAYAQSSPTISGQHGTVFLSSHMVAVADAQMIIKYTDPESGSATSAYVFSGHVAFRPANSPALWSTNLLVVNANNNKLYAKSLRISASTPTAAPAPGKVAAAPSAGANEGGGEDGGGGDDCSDVVSAAAELLHVQPQEIHVQPSVSKSPCIG